MNFYKLYEAIELQTGNPIEPAQMQDRSYHIRWLIRRDLQYLITLLKQKYDIDIDEKEFIDKYNLKSTVTIAEVAESPNYEIHGFFISTLMTNGRQIKEIVALNEKAAYDMITKALSKLSAQKPLLVIHFDQKEYNTVGKAISKFKAQDGYPLFDIKSMGEQAIAKYPRTNISLKPAPEPVQ